VIWRRGPWRNFEAVEFGMLEWVDWFNNKRLLEPIETFRGRSQSALLCADSGSRHGGVTQPKWPPQTRAVQLPKIGQF